MKLAIAQIVLGVLILLILFVTKEKQSAIQLGGINVMYKQHINIMLVMLGFMRRKQCGVRLLSRY